MPQKISRFAILGLFCIILTGCSVSASAPNQAANESEDSQVSSSTESNETAKVTSDIPSDWTEDEVKIWNLFSAIYPEVKIVSFAGKRALMSIPHDVCLAYDEGYSRLEIASVLNSSGSTSPAFNDDLMTLGVTYFCPQHMSQQIN